MLVSADNNRTATTDTRRRIPWAIGQLLAAVGAGV